MVTLLDNDDHARLAAKWLQKHRHGVDTSEAYDDLRQLLSVAQKEERSDVVAWCRMCAANNAALGMSPLREVKALTDRDARMFAFIADAIERGEHVSPRRHDGQEE